MGIWTVESSSLACLDLRNVSVGLATNERRALDSLRQKPFKVEQMNVNIQKELALELEAMCARFELFDKAAAIRAALDAPAKPVDCRGCKNFIHRTETCSLSLAPVTRPEPCTDFDQFQALTRVVLTKVTK